MPDSQIVGIVNGLKNGVGCHTQLASLCIKIVICLSPRPVIGNIMSNKQSRHVVILQLDGASCEWQSTRVPAHGNIVQDLARQWPFFVRIGTWQNRAHGAACPELAESDM